MGAAPDTGRVVFSSSGPTEGAQRRRKFVRYVIWRLVTAVLILFLVLTVVFIAVEVLPGDPTRVLLPRGGCASPSTECDLRDQLIRQWGLDQPLFDRFVLFLSNVLTGNLGPSMTYRPGIPVSDIISAAIPATLVLLGSTLLVVILLGLVLGIPLSQRRGRFVDSLASLLLAIPFALTPFVLALGLFGLFVIAVPAFPLQGSRSPGYASSDPLGQFVDSLWHLALPLTVSVLSLSGLYVWVVRDHPLRPEGVSSHSSPPGDWRAPKPGLRERLLGTVPRFFPGVPALLGWTVATVLIVDALFAYQGLGTRLWVATMFLDFPLLTGIVLVLALVFILPALVVADLIHHRATSRWVRADGLRVERFRVEPHDAWRGFKRLLVHPLGFAGLVLALVLVVMTAAAPLLVGPYPDPLTVAQPLMPPSDGHPLGTDYRGYDILTLTVYGGLSGLAVAIAAFAIALIAELGVTAAIGFFGHRAEVFVSIPVDLALVLPVPFAFLLVLAQTGISFAFFAGLVAWALPARLLLMELAGLVPEPPSGSPKPSWTARGRRSLQLVWGMGPVILGDALLGVSLALSVWGIMGFFGFSARWPLDWGSMINSWYNALGLVRGLWNYFLPPALCLGASVLAPLLLGLACKSIGPRPKPPELQPVPMSATPVTAPAVPAQ